MVILAVMTSYVDSVDIDENKGIYPLVVYKAGTVRDKLMLKGYDNTKCMQIYL